ncbi:MAG: glutamate 5-kinase [Ilumatobacteraceae bacterium]
MRLVVKIGTSSLTDERGVIDDAVIARLCDQIAAVRAAGHEVVLVTSGAVSAGVSALGLAERPSDLPTLQALAALGQPRLMERYSAQFARHSLVAGQALVIPPNFVNRRQYLHARQTLVRLLELGCVPIVNENDAIASDEIRWGDNDRIAALVSHLVAADLLVLLTDTPGLYTADPRSDPNAALIPFVAHDDPLLAVDAGRSGSNRGSGGMASKLAAARIASWSGVRAVIALASSDHVLEVAVRDDHSAGTTFEAHDRRLPARKLWIAFAAAPAGTIRVDDGATTALVDGHRSLLHAGVRSVSGHFDEGDTVEIAGPDGPWFARGMTLTDAATARRAAGRRSVDLPSNVSAELVHRDDLVILLAERARADSRTARRPGAGPVSPRQAWLLRRSRGRGAVEAELGPQPDN